MEGKLKLIFLDTFKNGPDYLDPAFDPDKVELCEVFTFDGEGGANIVEIGEYSGWDYLVVSFDRENYETIMRVLASLHVPHDRTIYISQDQIKCVDFQSIRGFFTNSYINSCEYYGKRNELTSNIMGKYLTLSVEDVSYVNVATDQVIMADMYTSGNNFAKDNMLRLYEETNKRFSFVDNQDIFCDIGANIGTTSIYFKKKIDPSVKILAFEPAKENYKLLRINLLLNDIDESEATVVKYAVSDKKGESIFEYDAENPGGSSLSFDEKTASSEVVHTISFDEYVEENGIDISRIKYIWVDIEGFEPSFFKGAEGTLGKINVPLITEFSPEIYKKMGSFGELNDVLNRLYEQFIILQEDEGTIHSIEELRNYEHLEYQIDIMLLK